MFGIEIRKIGNPENFFQEVDIVLQKYNIPNGSVNQNIQKQSVAHALQNMFQVDSYFSICTIDSCANLCQVIIPIERKRLYQSVHCISWNKMLPDFRQALIAMVLDDFRHVLNS